MIALNYRSFYLYYNFSDIKKNLHGSIEPSLYSTQLWSVLIKWIRIEINKGQPRATATASLSITSVRQFFCHSAESVSRQFELQPYLLLTGTELKKDDTDWDPALGEVTISQNTILIEIIFNSSSLSLSITLYSEIT